MAALIPTPAILDLATYTKPYVTPRALADYLGLSYRTIYHHIDKGTIQAVKIGGTLKIPLVEARKFASGTPARPALDADAPSAVCD